MLQKNKLSYCDVAFPGGFFLFTHLISLLN